MKKCSICKHVKSRDDFSNRKQSKDGKCSRCKACDKLHYEKNASRIKEYSIRWHHTRKKEFNVGIRSDRVIAFCVNRLLQHAKHRAAAINVPFALTPDDITTVPISCPILDIPLIMGDDQNHPSSPSLDRIVPELGYVPGNVHIISLRANMIKSNATRDDITRVAEWLNRH